MTMADHDLPLRVVADKLRLDARLAGTIARTAAEVLRPDEAEHGDLMCLMRELRGRLELRVAELSAAAAARAPGGGRRAPASGGSRRQG
jgi:hypothetical protein